MEIRREDITSAAAQSLILELNAELSSRYPEPGATNFRLDPEEVDALVGAFLIAYDDGAAVGCGAIRKLDADTAEIKRMFVKPASRGRGVGRHLLTAIEAEARRLGVSRVVLETGIRQPEALGLYEQFGFERIPPYGEYGSSAETSVCMAKRL